MGYDVTTMEPGTDKSTQRLQRRKWGPLAGLQQNNAAVVRPRPKNDVHGLGYDPYANADEFRVARKHLRDGPGVQPQRDRQGSSLRLVVVHLNRSNPEHAAVPHTYCTVHMKHARVPETVPGLCCTQG